MTTMYKWPLVAIAFFTMLAGCAENSSQANGDGVSPKQMPSLDSEQPMAAEKTDSEVGVVELSARTMAPAITDLAARAGVDQSEIHVVHAVAVTWNDSSLGCPQPGQSYTQVLVPGFWVVLEQDGRRYSYHAGRQGAFRLCKNARPGPLDSPPGGRRDTDV